MLLRRVAENKYVCNTLRSPTPFPFAYAPQMQDWAKRFRAHMRLHHLSQERLGSELDVSQGAIGHWLRGEREINLSDFLALCAAAGADPRAILFGNDNPHLVSEIRQALAAHPELIPSYTRFEKSMRRRKSRRKTEV